MGSSERCGSGITVCGLESHIPLDPTRLELSVKINVDRLTFKTFSIAEPFCLAVLAVRKKTDGTKLLTSCNVDGSGKSSHLPASKGLCNSGLTRREI